MKNKALIFASAFIFLVFLPVTAQELGDKVQKQVTVDGKQLYKWVIYDYIEEDDENENLVHEKYSSGYERWLKYDSNGNEIHIKDNSGYEQWYEYDSNGNLIHRKGYDGYECL